MNNDHMTNPPDWIGVDTAGPFAPLAQPVERLRDQRIRPTEQIPEHLRALEQHAGTLALIQARTAVAAAGHGMAADIIEQLIDERRRDYD